MPAQVHLGCSGESTGDIMRLIRLITRIMGEMQDVDYLSS